MPEPHPHSIRHEVLEDDGTFPNNQELPVLIYTSAFDAQRSDLADWMERTFRQHEWTGAWRNGIY